MPIQSLGIFDSVFDWVCDKLFSPIIDWLSKILNSIFEWILNTIVMPLLKPVFDFLWNIVIANIADLFYTFIYNGYCKFLWLLDQLQNGFDVLIGLKDVTYTAADTGEKTQTTLLQYFMNNEIIRNALISITFIALALSVIFAIYSVMRSTLDFDFEGKRPVGRVLNSVAKTMIAFLLVPVIAVFGVSLASIVLKQTCTAISGGDASLGKWVLAISSINAGRGNPPAPFTNPSTGLIAEPWASLVEGSTDYLTFGVQIHISQIDYLLGYASIIFMAIVMIMCLFTFIKRIFDIIILYITSPYFVSTIVLDDGEKFKRWRENFIARVLVGFGSVIGMRIFLMMVPVIMNDQLKIFDSVAGNITGGYVIRLVFILGGMFAVYKSSTLLTGIINANVAAEENMNNALVGGMIMSGVKKGGKALWGKGKDAFSGLMAKSSSSSAGGGAKAASSSNKFTGGSDSAPGKLSLPKNADSAAKKSAEAENKAPEKDDILGLSGDSLKDDYIGKSVLDAEKEATEDVDPLGKVDGLDNFDFDADYLSKDLDGDFSGNADISGIASFDGEAEAEDIPDKFEMADDAIKQNGEQTLFFGDDTVTKSDDYDIGNMFNEDYTDEKPLFDGDLTDVLNEDYSLPDTEGVGQFSDNISDLGSQISTDDYSVPDISDIGHFSDNITDLGSLISTDDYSVADISDSGHFADNISDLDSVLHSDNYQPEADRQAQQDRDEIAAREAARAQRMAQRRHSSSGTDSTFTSTGNDPLKNPESSFTANIPSASGSARPVDTTFSSTGNDPLKNPESSRNANISAASGSARPADSEFSSAANDPLKNPPKDNNSKK